MEEEKNNTNVKTQKPEIPFEVAVEDTKDAIIQIINTCGLPACVITEILTNATTQISNVSRNITNQKRTEYNEQLTKWKNNSNDNN